MKGFVLYNFCGFCCIPDIYTVEQPGVTETGRCQPSNTYITLYKCAFYWFKHEWYIPKHSRTLPEKTHPHLFTIIRHVPL